MIFPILRGWLGPSRAPVTWVLVVLNVMMFSVTSRLSPEAQAEVDKFTRDEFFLRTQGRLYARWLADHPAVESSVVKTLAEKVNAGDLTRAEVLGQLAFRDEDFANAHGELTFAEDPVALSIYRARSARMRLDQDAHPNFELGVNAIHPSLSRWVTYIFVHSGSAHLLGNMLFLILFGVALELQLGGLGLLATFVGSGVAAAGVFALVTGLSSSPLVGASGAISGVMALYCTLNGGRPVRFFWALLPIRGYVGWIWLPAWCALVIWGAADVAGLVATPPQLGGVAHAAHLGGDLAGLLVGLALRAWRARHPVDLAEIAPAPFIPAPF